MSTTNKKQMLSIKVGILEKVHGTGRCAHGHESCAPQIKLKTPKIIK